MSQARNRTQACGAPQARQRLRHRAFSKSPNSQADVNDLSLEYASVAASVAILAGIAAADASCCQELGRRSRSDDHHNAETLIEQITPGGKRAASHLRQMLNLKDTAHYGFISITAPELKRSLRQARHLVEFAETILQRSSQ